MQNCCILCGLIVTMMWDEVVLADVDCYSCFDNCQTQRSGKYDPVSCDCTSEKRCRASACFVKIELFHEERASIIQVTCFIYFFSKSLNCSKF